jgi:nucleoside-diphosphate-sugar epimerase
MRVLVTGATGFVGAPVTRALVSAGHEVHALVWGDDGLDRIRDLSIARIEGDLVKPESYLPAVARVKPELAIHLAWMVRGDYLGSRESIDQLGAGARLFRELVDLGCARIVGVGTCFEYDTSLGVLSETSPTAPRHMYSACKRALFDIGTLLTAGTATSFAWPRLFYLYGPHESPNRLVASVIGALLRGERARVSSGEQVRDFLHVDDAGAAIAHVATRDVEGAINIGSGVPTPVRDLVATIGRILGAEDRIDYGAIAPRPGDPAVVCANVERLARSGWTPPRDLERGLRDTVAWMRDQSRAQRAPIAP